MDFIFLLRVLMCSHEQKFLPQKIIFFSVGCEKVFTFHVLHREQIQIKAKTLAENDYWWAAETRLIFFYEQQ
jgi:hypothetical protein